jgi:protein TonB
MAAAATLHLGAALLVLLPPAADAVPAAAAPALRLFELAAIPAEPAASSPPAPVSLTRQAATAAALPAVAAVPAAAAAVAAPAATPAEVANAAGFASIAVGEDFAPAPAAAPPATVPAPTAIRDLYAQRLWQHILAWKPPGATMTGTAIVQFVIDRSGALQDVSLARSSGSARLDSIALRSVRLAAPMPAPPEALGDEDLRFALAFSFG